MGWPLSGEPSTSDLMASGHPFVSELLSPAERHSLGYDPHDKDY